MVAEIKSKTKSEFLEKIEKIIIILFVLLALCIRLVVRTNVFLILTNAVLILAGTIGWIYIVMVKQQFIMFYAGISTICWVLEIFMKRAWNYDVMDFFSSLLYMGIAFFILTFQHNFNILRKIYIFASLLIIFRIAVVGESFILIMVGGNSYNYISIIFLFLLGMVLITNNNLKNSQIIAYYVLYFMICILSYGRGGIVSGTVLIAGVLFINVFQRKNKTQALFMFAFMLIIIVVIVVFGQTIGNAIIAENYFGKFNHYGFDSNGRLDIWSNYLKDCFSSIYAVVLGGDQFKNLSISNGELNLHNSYLQMYASYGLMYFLLNVFLMGKTIRKKINEKNWYMLIYLFAFMIRAFTDKMMFEWPCEIIYYYFIFDYLISKSSRKVVENKEVVNLHNMDGLRRDI